MCITRYNSGVTFVKRKLVTLESAIKFNQIIPNLLTSIVTQYAAELHKKLTYSEPRNETILRFHCARAILLESILVNVKNYMLDIFFSQQVN